MEGERKRKGKRREGKRRRVELSTNRLYEIRKSTKYILEVHLVNNKVVRKYHGNDTCLYH